MHIKIIHLPFPHAEPLGQYVPPEHRTDSRSTLSWAGDVNLCPGLLFLCGSDSGCGSEHVQLWRGWLGRVCQRWSGPHRHTAAAEAAATAAGDGGSERERWVMAWSEPRGWQAHFVHPWAHCALKGPLTGSCPLSI